MEQELAEVQNHFERNTNYSGSFILSAKLKDDYENLSRDDWATFLKQLQSKDAQGVFEIKRKDLLILKLYANFMNDPKLKALANQKDQDRAFQEEFIRLVESYFDTVSDLLHPELCFRITKESKNNIKQLLLKLQQEKMLDEQVSTNSISFSESFTLDPSADSTAVMEAFTNILFEAL